MAIELSYKSARKQFTTLLNRASKDHEVIIIKRRGSEDVAMIAASELTSLAETAYLLRSPENAKRLLSALAHAFENDSS